MSVAGDMRKLKSGLRKDMNSVLDSLDVSDILRQSHAVTSMVLEHPAYKEAHSVSVYLSFDNEVQTDTIVRDIFKAGKTCYIPRFEAGDPDMHMVSLHSLEDYLQLPLNRWNIRQPDADVGRVSVFDAGRLDLVLAPGLAFTTFGHRLGRGKGYYDRFLTRCSADLEVRPSILGLALKQQVLPSIPCADHDVMVDGVLFDRR